MRTAFFYLYLLKFGVQSTVTLVYAVPSICCMWLIAGGVCYTVGAIFYLWKKLPFQHGCPSEFLCQ